MEDGVSEEFVEHVKSFTKLVVGKHAQRHHCECHRCRMGVALLQKLGCDQWLTRIGYDPDEDITKDNEPW